MFFPKTLFNTTNFNKKFESNNSSSKFFKRSVNTLTKYTNNTVNTHVLNSTKSVHSDGAVYIMNKQKNSANKAYSDILPNDKLNITSNPSPEGFLTKKSVINQWLESKVNTAKTSVNSVINQWLESTVNTGKTPVNSVIPIDYTAEPAALLGSIDLGVAELKALCMNIEMSAWGNINILKCILVENLLGYSGVIFVHLTQLDPLNYSLLLNEVSYRVNNCLMAPLYNGLSFKEVLFTNLDRVDSFISGNFAVTLWGKDINYYRIASELILDYINRLNDLITDYNRMVAIEQYLSQYNTDLAMNSDEIASMISNFFDMINSFH
jgi:hypothetical protein